MNISFVVGMSARLHLVERSILFGEKSMMV